jgi:hypothetical protein
LLELDAQPSVARSRLPEGAAPAGTELSFGFFQLSSGQETVAGLIDTSSYTCTSTAPATPPPGAGAMEIYSTGGS